MFNDYGTPQSQNFFRPDHHCFGRPHGGGHGFGAFAAAFGGAFGRGGGGFRTGRKFASADLHLLILALLEDKPRHGYELIKALEERSGGFYSPSPGMIYPALTYLEEIGQATVTPDGVKKLYSITETGRQHLEENRAAVNAMFGDLEKIGSRMGDVRRAFSGEQPRGDEDEHFDPRRGPREFHEARRALKMAMFAARGSSPEEIKRITEILHRAAADIKAGKL